MNDLSGGTKNLHLGKCMLRFSGAVIVLSTLVGSSVAIFLQALDLVTHLHWYYPWLLFGLPFAGLLSWWIYQMINQNADAGNRLLWDRIRKPDQFPKVPAAMAPLVLLGTLITHLFGGSAGREGTAVQMGGSISSWLSGWVSQSEFWQRSLLMCGVSAGFGAVFGTPIAGAIFAVEVARLGRSGVFHIGPCLVSGYLAHYVAMVLGVEHSTFFLASLSVTSTITDEVSTSVPFALMSGASWWRIVVASVLFGWISVLFVKSTHGVNRQLKRWIRKAWLRPMIGGAALVGFTWMLGSRDYLGIGVDLNPNQSRTVCIASSFEPGGGDNWSWLWKLISTSLIVGSGFKGGEVTPLFFIGSTAGNAVGQWLHFPVDLMAALGFVAVFAGATKSPVASALMAVELFTPNNPELMSSGFIVPLGVACFISCLASGRSTIYEPVADRTRTERSTMS